MATLKQSVGNPSPVDFEQATVKFLHLTAQHSERKRPLTSCDSFFLVLVRRTSLTTHDCKEEAKGETVELLR